VGGLVFGALAGGAVPVAELLVAALLVAALLVAAPGAPLVGVALTGALALGPAVDARLECALDCAPAACAAPILSACCSARALVHAATTATTSTVSTPRRARLDLRRDVEEAKIACHIRIWAERAATTTVRAMRRARHSRRDFFPSF
jgi:hypothetical protein